MMKNRRSNQSQRFRNIILAVLILGLMGLGVWVLYTRDSGVAKDSGASKIDNTPATSQDQSFSDSKKEKQPVSNSGSSTNASSDQKKVEVTITTYNATDNGSLSVNGYVSGVVENGGTCILTLTDSASKSVTTTRQAIADATTTTCGESAVALSKLHSGTWKAVLSYSSATSVGASEPVNIEVN
jgi:hypothetical protein